MIPNSEMADFYLSIKENGIKEAIVILRKSDAPPLGANDLNGLGYEFIQSDEKEASIEIFKLAVDLYPQDSNLWDSLGEAYMISRDFEQAMKNYKKPLKLNPRNTNANAMIERMEKEAKERNQ